MCTRKKENLQKQLGIPAAATVHIIRNVKLIVLKPPTDPKLSEASKDKVETDNFISGAHMIVMVPASGSVLIRISKLGFKSIRLGSVTLKNRSLSRASLALLQDPTTRHNKTSCKGNRQEKNPVYSSRKKLFQQNTLNPCLLGMFVKLPGTTYICGKPSTMKEIFKHYHIIFQWHYNRHPNLRIKGAT